MNFKTGIGKPGLALAMLLAFAMCLLSLIFSPVSISRLEYGLCLPSPDTWDFNPFFSWFINAALIGIIALLLFLVNKSYNFNRTTEPALTAIFLIMATSIPWFTEGINTSVLLCVANVVCMGIIFDTYDTRNATKEMFILGVLAGMGSMVQYAYLPMAGVYLLWALFMKVLRAKETLALLAGLVCPYWIALGSGALHFSDFHFPSIIPLFNVEYNHSDFILLLVAIGIAMAAGFLLTLINSVKLYAGNSRVNAMNLCVMTLGAASSLFILVDYDNMPAYVVTLFMCCAVELANICALWNPPMPWTVTVVPSALYIAIFILSILF